MKTLPGIFTRAKYYNIFTEYFVSDLVQYKCCSAVKSFSCEGLRVQFPLNSNFKSGKILLEMI